jgi:hypothetical protein
VPHQSFRVVIQPFKDALLADRASISASAKSGLFSVSANFAGAEVQPAVPAGAVDGKRGIPHVKILTAAGAFGSSQQDDDNAEQHEPYGEHYAGNSV